MGSTLECYPKIKPNRSIRIDIARSTLTNECLNLKKLFKKHKPTIGRCRLADYLLTKSLKTYIIKVNIEKNILK